MGCFDCSFPRKVLTSYLKFKFVVFPFLKLLLNVFGNQANLQDLKQQLPENLRDDIGANDEIYEDIIGTEASGVCAATLLLRRVRK